jgi:hypothetical protein
MAVWYSMWPFVIFFPIWSAWTKNNLATLRFGRFQCRIQFYLEIRNSAALFCLPWITVAALSNQKI